MTYLEIESLQVCLRIEVRVHRIRVGSKFHVFIRDKKEHTEADTGKKALEYGGRN